MPRRAQAEWHKRGGIEILLLSRAWQTPDSARQPGSVVRLSQFYFRQDSMSAAYWWYLSESQSPNTRLLLGKLLCAAGIIMRRSQYNSSKDR